MKSKHVIIIEDEKSVMLGLRLHLLSMDFELTCFGNGLTAYDEIIEKNRQGIQFDLVITDIVLPEKNGFEVIDGLQDCNIYIPTIVISGYADKKMFEKLQQRGIDCFLQKPFSFPELKEQIERILN